MRFLTAIMVILLTTSTQMVASSESIAPPPDGDVARLRPWFETNILATLAKKMNPRQDVEIELWVAWGGKMEDVRLFEAGARKPIQKLTETECDKVLHAIGQLGAEEFSRREEAAKILREMGRKALPLLRETASDSNQDLEVRTRSAQVINQLEHALIQPEADAYLKKLLVPDEACFNRRFVLTFSKEEFDRSIPPPPAERVYPLWDGVESSEAYARRVGLPAEKSVKLGNGVCMEFVLIPATKFLMGTPMPEPPSETPLTGQTMLGSCAVLLIALFFIVVVRGLRKRRWPQFSLSYMLLMLFVASMAVWGGVRWQQALVAQAQYARDVERYKNVDDREKPAHYVTLKRPYYFGKYEVTLEQYGEVMNTHEKDEDDSTLSSNKINSLKGTNPKLPFSNIRNRFDAFEFCRNLQEKCKASLRLPTEAEWEFACKDGIPRNTCSEDFKSQLDSNGWYFENTKSSVDLNLAPKFFRDCMNSKDERERDYARRWVTQQCGAKPVGTKAPNAFGLYDMRGNVWEICQDVYSYYSKEDRIEPQEPFPYPIGFYQHFIIRGGSAKSQADDCRSTTRSCTEGDRIHGLVGMRIVMDVE